MNANVQANVHGLGLLMLLAGGVCGADPVVEETTAQRTFPVSSSSPKLVVHNIWGNVTVRAGVGRDITVSIHERRSAPTQVLLDRSKELIPLITQASDDGVSMIVGQRDRKPERTDVCRGCRVDYQFEITVPADTLVDVGTVTDGRVEVSGIRAPVVASNVNGPVVATELSDCANIKSVNGSLDVKFSSAPGTDCRIETINGRITVALPPSAGLDAVLDINHGHIESDFDVQTVTLPVKLEKQEHEVRSTYRIEQFAGMRVGAGGPTFTFASLNGDVHIRMNK